MLADQAIPIEHGLFEQLAGFGGQRLRRVGFVVGTVTLQLVRLCLFHLAEPEQNARRAVVERILVEECLPTLARRRILLVPEML